MINRIYAVILIVLAGLLLSCKHTSSGYEVDGSSEKTVTPVTVTHITSGTMSDDMLLSAVSVFQKKSVIKSNINGYIKKALVNPGQTIHSGQLLFVLKTKEAEAIGDQADDSSLQFNGITRVRASQDGYVSQLDHGQGDYIMDGEQLGIVADENSFVFMLEVPFELSPYVKAGHSCDIILADERHITGDIYAKIPTVNPSMQTQQFIVRINPQYHLPENLIAKVSIPRSVNHHAMILPKPALLTDETQTNWWVMKMINDSTAVRIPVDKGIETDTSVQIISPRFLPSDRILVSGNYGLADTAFVKVETAK